jgi:hypothetical protein
MKNIVMHHVISFAVTKPGLHTPRNRTVQGRVPFGYRMDGQLRQVHELDLTTSMLAYQGAMSRRTVTCTVDTRVFNMEQQFREVEGCSTGCTIDFRIEGSAGAVIPIGLCQYYNTRIGSYTYRTSKICGKPLLTGPSSTSPPLRKN